MEEKKPPIWFGAVVWNEFRTQALGIKKMEQAINEAIDLSTYGTGLQSINFIPIAVLPGNIVHEEEVKYFTRKKELRIHLKLDYDEVKGSDETEFLQQVALLFINAIDDFQEYGVEDFDLQRFKDDVADLFEANGWVG
jgi:hypothetical protein